jgi:hypothetical protein
MLVVAMPEKKFPDSGFPILPTTKVAALLDRYPEVEEILIGLAPPFQKLKNPILRRSVAKVASLQQVAAVGRIPTYELVNRLREAVGQDSLACEEASSNTVSYYSPRPEWFNTAKVVASIDVRTGDPNQMPIAAVLRAAARLQPAEIVELTTTFLPVPGIDILRKKGLLVWSMEDESKLIRTYVSKPVH